MVRVKSAFTYLRLAATLNRFNAKMVRVKYKKKRKVYKLQISFNAKMVRVKWLFAQHIGNQLYGVSMPKWCELSN